MCHHNCDAADTEMWNNSDGVVVWAVWFVRCNGFAYKRRCLFGGVWAWRWRVVGSQSCGDGRCCLAISLSYSLKKLRLSMREMRSSRSVSILLRLKME